MTGLTAPPAPGRLGSPIQPAALLSYLGQLDAWVGGRRAELASLDAEIVASGLHADLTPDMALSLALWQSVKNRYDLLLLNWDSGRVGPAETERMSSLIWGRLDTGGSPISQLSGMAVSLPEACRLSDALAAQLRTRLNLDPTIEAQAGRLRDLRAQLERIRDQIQLEPPASQASALAAANQLAARLAELEQKRQRGGDVGGLLGPLEIDAAHQERDLIVGAAQRRENRDLLARAREVTEELAAREQALTRLVGATIATVSPAPKYAVPDLAALGPIPNTRPALEAYLARLEQVGRAMQLVQDAYGSALAEHDQVAGLLQVLGVKADTLGLAEDRELADLLGLITRVLARKPAPMPVVRQLVAAVQTQIDWLSADGRGVH